VVGWRVPDRRHVLVEHQGRLGSRLDIGGLDHVDLRQPGGQIFEPLVGCAHPVEHGQVRLVETRGAGLLGPPAEALLGAEQRQHGRVFVGHRLLQAGDVQSCERVDPGGVGSELRLGAGDDDELALGRERRRRSGCAGPGSTWWHGSPSLCSAAPL
jgi:hypothetical protein